MAKHCLHLWAMPCGSWDSPAHGDDQLQGEHGRESWVRRSVPAGNQHPLCSGNHTVLYSWQLFHNTPITGVPEPEQRAFGARWEWMRCWCVVPDPHGIPTLSSASDSACYTSVCV